MDTNDAIQAEAAAWVARRDRGELDGASRAALDAWLADAVTHRVAYLRLSEAWAQADRLGALSRRTTTRSARRRALPGGAAWRTTGRRWIPAAVALGCAATVALAIRMGGRPGDEVHDYATPIGAREVVALADGSKLTLNTATRLATKIDARERTVWLNDGEAYFDVAHDAARPFVVVVGDRRVVVTGTRFSVRRDGERLDVTVLEGRVQVQSADKPLTLVSRNETAIGVGADVLVTAQTEARSQAAVGWLDGRLFFDQTTMAEAAAQFNRYNRKKIVIADPEAAAIRIGGSFEAGNIDVFARLVASGFGLTVRETGDEIRIASAR